MVTTSQSQLKRFVILSILVVLIVSAQPWLWRKVFAQAQQLRNQQTQGQQLEQLRSRIEEVSATVEGQRKAVEQLDVLFPPQDKLPQIVERLEQEAAKANLAVVVQAINEQPPLREKEAARGLVPLVITVELSGSADNLLRFIDGIEHTSEFVRVQEWQLDEVPLNQGGAPYMLGLQAVFYLQEAE